MLNDDYKEILQIFRKCKVRFLIVGAYAMGVYGYPRATGDIDIWVEASHENSRKILKALKIFGAPVKSISDDTFCQDGIIFQIGVPPRRIDIITAIDGVRFNKAFKHKKNIVVERLRIPFISNQDLIKNKESTGREKDRIDLQYLRKIIK